MSGWMILAAWFVGWLLAARPAMRRTMLQKVCDECDSGWGCECRDGVLVVRGSKFERSGAHVAWSLWIAAWWPVWLLFVIVARLARLIGSNLSRAVIAATPLTAPELERRLAEREREIARLTKQIEGTAP